MFRPFKAIARKVTMLAAVMAASVAVTSCDTLIFQEEGDCTTHYYVNFRYDLNLKWADAFANEVKSVNLYVFDRSGILVSAFTEASDVLADPNYRIELDVPAGQYTLVAWCGTRNPGAQPDQFIVPDVETGKTKTGDLTCRINRIDDPTYGKVVGDRLEFMFHGKLEVELPADDNGGEYTYTVPLTKDTNHLRVVLQHLSGKNLDPSQFSFRLEDANGYYAHDNTLLPDDRLTYRPYYTGQGVASIIRNENSKASVQSRTVLTDISMGRLMSSRQSDMVLTVTNDAGKDIARIPVIDYALLAKEYYETAYGHTMTDQEFLDRQDEYSMTLFIDENNEWYSAEIYIESWRIVLQDVEQ